MVQVLAALAADAGARWQLTMSAARACAARRRFAGRVLCHQRAEAHVRYARAGGHSGRVQRRRVLSTVLTPRPARSPHSFRRFATLRKRSARRTRSERRGRAPRWRAAPCEEAGRPPPPRSSDWGAEETACGPPRQTVNRIVYLRNAFINEAFAQHVGAPVVCIDCAHVQLIACPPARRGPESSGRELLPNFNQHIQSSLHTSLSAVQGEGALRRASYRSSP
jgi:hypothetical protein